MCSVVSLQFHVNVIIPRRNLRRLRSLEASYHWHFFRQGKKKETTFSVLCILRYLADVSSFEEILTYYISEDCRQLCFWKRAKQPSPGSAISKEEICSLLSFVFAGGVLNSQGRDNPRTPKKKTSPKKNTAHCSILAFRTNCSTLSWLRCAFFRLRLNFAFELLSKEEICSLLSFVFAGGVLNSQGRDNPRTPKKKITKKNTAHCSILAFRTNCSTLSWLRCAFFRLRLNFAFELLSKEEICSLLSFVFAGGVLNSQGRDNPRTPPKKKNKGEAFPRPWAQQLEPGKKKDLRCFRTWAQQLDPVVDL